MRWVHIHDVLAELAAIKQPSSEGYEIGLVVVDWRRKLKQGRADGQTGNSSRDQQPIVGCLAPHDRACGHMRVPCRRLRQISNAPGVKKLLDFGGVRGRTADSGFPMSRLPVMHGLSCSLALVRSSECRFISSNYVSAAIQSPTSKIGSRRS